jgi:hypothetical protein
LLGKVKGKILLVLTLVIFKKIKKIIQTRMKIIFNKIKHFKKVMRIYYNFLYLKFNKAN